MRASPRSIVVAAVVGLLVLPFSACDVSTKGVAWKDIAGWRLDGYRWAEALDKSGTTVAIYDLSYPDLRQEVGLGTIGADHLTVQQILDVLEGHESDPQSPQDPQGAIHHAKLAEVIRLLGGGAAAGAGAGATGAASPVLALHDRFPPDWWKQIKWRSPIQVTDKPPTEFTLDDIDLGAMATDASAVTSIVNRLAALADSDGNLLLGPDFLKHFVFHQADGGAYEMRWTPRLESAASRPKKLLDLTNPKLGWYETLAWEGIQEGVGELIGLIPVPVVADLVGLAIDRFFHLQNRLRTAHLQLMLEQLAPAAGSAALPLFPQLPAAQVNDVELASNYAMASDYTPILWLHQDPAMLWLGDRASELSQAMHSAAWVKAQGQLTEMLGDRNARATYDAVDGIVALAYVPKASAQAPAVEIDYANPGSILAYRQLIDELTVAISFATDFVPLPVIGDAVGEVWSYFVTDPISTAQNWESRLTSNLETESADWSRELGWLDQQQLNPFELSRADASALILERRRLIGK